MKKNGPAPNCVVCSGPNNSLIIIIAIKLYQDSSGGKSQPMNSVKIKTKLKVGIVDISRQSFIL